MDKKELLKRLVADMKKKETQVEEEGSVPMIPSNKGLTERVDLDKASKIAKAFGGGEEETEEVEEVADESENRSYLQKLFPFFFPEEEPTPTPIPTPTAIATVAPKKKCKDDKKNC